MNEFIRVYLIAFFVIISLIYVITMIVSISAWLSNWVDNKKSPLHTKIVSLTSPFVISAIITIFHMLFKK